MTYPNPEQRQVLDHLHGTLLVLAPAGTGKTRIMADRLAAVIAAGMPPEVTLGVTFTNRAAEHMRGAVLESCGPAAKLCRIQTFHSLCAWMLRLESRDLGLPSDFVIYDEQDSIDLMRECLKAPDISPDSLFQQLSQMKSDCTEQELTLATIPALDMRRLAAPVRATVLAYHQHLAERNALDFPDLLYRTRAMLALLPEKRAKWSARFQWIQMDEVQDTHLSEYEVIRLLATHATGIAFFGDLDRFIEFFQRHDDPARPPADLLAELTNRAALARNLDFLATDDASIPILTVHQSKGLEFDTVIIAGLAEDEFPSYYSKKDLKLEEEKRLFDVALTRAKRHLILSSYQINDWGHEKPPSSFLTGLI
jgi:superfamily I DNA/RNA helicase